MITGKIEIELIVPTLRQRRCLPNWILCVGRFEERQEIFGGGIENSWP